LIGSRVEEFVMRALALPRYFEALANGEPLAVGLALLFMLGVAFAAACWVIDRKKKWEKEEKKRRRKDRMSRRQLEAQDPNHSPDSHN
jgi:hypothetical protein